MFRRDVSGTRDEFELRKELPQNYRWNYERIVTECSRLKYKRSASGMTKEMAMKFKIIAIELISSLSNAGQGSSEGNRRFEDYV